MAPRERAGVRGNKARVAEAAPERSEMRRCDLPCQKSIGLPGKCITFSNPGREPEPLFMRVLVVEDEKKTHEYLKKGLTEDGFVVDVAFNGEDGLHLALTGDCDLIIL